MLVLKFRFNTTIVSVESAAKALRELGISAFQYNHCFGGIKGTAYGYKQKNVSIQPLFRWNLEAEL